MTKRIFAVMLSAVLLVTMVQASVLAFADNTFWQFDSDTNTLTISGFGEMDNYEDEFSSPWFSCINQIEHIVVEEGVTSIGEYAFAGASALYDVSLPNTIETINNYAFSSCSELYYLYFPESVKSIADSSFAYDGLSVKADFSMGCEPASYALNYAFKNNIPFISDTVKCGDYNADIVVKGLMVYYPYTAKVSGTFKFYSTGRHDTYGYLYDSSHNILRSNDDVSSSNTNFSITYNLVKGHTYYFAARIYNSSLLGSFAVHLEAVDYSVSGSIYAMLNKNGDCSDILIDEALIDGDACGGEFEYYITEPLTVTIEAGNVRLDKTFSPDDDTQDIAVQMCEVNNDGIINGKDYAIMYRSNSKYTTLFRNFVNFRV